DDRNIVEFGLARSVGMAMTTATDLRNVAREANMSRPPLYDDKTVLWDRLDPAWMSYNASAGAIDNRYVGPNNEQARQAALAQYYGGQKPMGGGQLSGPECGAASGAT